MPATVARPCERRSADRKRAARDGCSQNLPNHHDDSSSFANPVGGNPLNANESVTVRGFIWASHYFRRPVLALGPLEKRHSSQINSDAFGLFARLAEPSVA